MHHSNNRESCIKHGFGLEATNELLLTVKAPKRCQNYAVTHDLDSKFHGLIESNIPK